MKKTIIITLLFIGLSSAMAQTIQNVPMAFSQTLFPKKILPDNVKTYSCTITTPT
ncbi:MAG: hypothetical protein M0D53_03885 [Flavobacterium sp. JAD_PAG50586_2]|nr:MAG: hypothetical protein M0D53_03885 [Flavobacterium sp. JAD_PAG50586_2]